MIPGYSVQGSDGDGSRPGSAAGANARASPPGDEEELHHRVHAAMATAVAFLDRQQLPNGELKVKRLRPVDSDWLHDPSIFASALVTWSLRHTPGTGQIRSRACAFIATHREPLGVWRHWVRGHAQFHYVPPDLDDTSVASISLRDGAGILVRNRPLILANRAPNGLFFSWISLRRRWVSSAAYWWISLTHLLRDPKKSIAFYQITPSERHDIDAVVNSNVLMYLGSSQETEPIVNFLLDLLREGKEVGSDKWYDNPFVFWYFFSRALRQAKADAGPLVLARLRSRKPVSALEIALATCARLDWGETPGATDIEALMDAQLESGGWPLEPFYKGERTRWGSEELSTGFCLEALSRWRMVRQL